jgi:hypothetical protein
MADRGRVDDANAFVGRLPPVRVVEKTCAIAKRYGHDVDFHFVDQTGFEILLGDIGATTQGNVFAVRSVPGPLKRHIGSFGDEVKSCSTLHLKWAAGVMGENEDRQRRKAIPGRRRSASESASNNRFMATERDYVLGLTTRQAESAGHGE